MVSNHAPYFAPIWIFLAWACYFEISLSLRYYPLIVVLGALATFCRFFAIIGCHLTNFNRQGN
jgi:Na+-transporting methylmalonyl-CoA/oxaloacetate decarboxylase beta subunit